MIRSITQKKPEEEIERLLKGFNRVFIIGCGTCVTLTHTGGEVGQIELTPEIVGTPTFYRHDVISGKFYHYVDCVNDIPVRREDCIGLECAAVWTPEQIAERLLDEKLGRPNRSVESTKAENR